VAVEGEEPAGSLDSKETVSEGEPLAFVGHVTETEPKP